jgi:large subunit ribosomal protein L25
VLRQCRPNGSDTFNQAGKQQEATKVMSEIAIDVQKRETVGKESNRKLRNAGLVPAVVYGAGKEPVAIQLQKKNLLDIFRSGVEKNAIFLLKLEGTGQERHAMIREMQVDPIDRSILHIDFQRVLLTQKVAVKVPIELVGIAYGVKTQGGVLDFVNREVEIRALPTQIPPHLELDITHLHVGHHIELSAVALPAGVELIDDPEKVIVSIAHVRGEVPGEEGEEKSAEPEVIKRGKEKAEA